MVQGKTPRTLKYPSRRAIERRTGMASNAPPPRIAAVVPKAVAPKAVVPKAVVSAAPTSADPLAPPPLAVNTIELKYKYWRKEANQYYAELNRVNGLLITTEGSLDKKKEDPQCQQPSFIG